MKYAIRDMLDERIRRCPKRPKRGKGRPAKTILTGVRARAWAQYCSFRAGGSNRKIGAGIIARQIIRTNNNQRDKRSYSANWRKYLKGEIGVSPGTIDEIDNIWPDTKPVFEVGPQAPCGAYMDDIAELVNPQTGGNVPLWAAIKGEVDDLLIEWKEVGDDWWFLWSPWQMPLDPNDVLFSYNEVNDDVKVINSWRPDHKHFRDNIALADFLKYYDDNPACYPDTSALLCLTACITRARLNDERFCVLPPLFNYNQLTLELSVYSISFQDIVTAACEYGLTVLTAKEHEYLRVGNKDMGYGSFDCICSEHAKMHDTALRIRESYRKRETEFLLFPVNSTKPYGY